jgi:adenosylhomocysteine nucleosidase
MRVLVTFAVDAEFAPWRKLRTFRETVLNAAHWSGGVRVFEAQIDGHTVWVYLTGMGIKCFDIKCALSVRAAGADAVLSSGLAGSLNSGLKVLSIAAPRRVGTLRDATGQGVSRALVDFAGQRGATLVDKLLTSDRIVDLREEKYRLSQFADLVDMESFHIVRSFINEQIPVAVVRCVSDGSDEQMPVDFEKCLDSNGSVKMLPLLKELAKQPGKVPALIRFGQQSRAAAEKIVRFLDDYIRALRPEILEDKIVEIVGE